MATEATEETGRARGAAHACAACGGPVGRGPAEHLWFYSRAPHARHRIGAALARAGVAPTLEGDVVKVAVGVVAAPDPGTAAPLVDAAAAALTAAEAATVKVAWIASGADPLGAAIAAPTLDALRVELAHRWFFQLLDDEGLRMHFQPIVALDRPVVVAHEALARATRDGRTLAGGELVAAAARADLLVPFDARARLAAIEGFAASGLAGLVFVNFQPSAIYNPRYCMRLTFAAIKRAGLDPARVVFEVVESEDVADVARLRAIVDVYRAHGLKVALDDFGVGYSTAERLLRLRPDYVKLDKSLVAGVAGDAAAQDAIAAIVRLARAEGGAVIAEGIETPAQQEAVRALGVGLAQGYLYARPAPRPVVTWPA
jgi:EAL domain-containing protein (putative c-di-GMP-specific phosphodiesterase class I)